MRSIQDIDSCCFEVLAEILVRKTRNGFDPLCGLSTSMFVNQLRYQFSASGAEAGELLRTSTRPTLYLLLHIRVFV
jgi:hypothetical protein